MYKYDPLLTIELAPSNVHQEMATELNKNESWRVLAAYYGKLYEYDDLIHKLETHEFMTPVEHLLAELDDHEINIGMLCLLLKDCRLYKTMQVLMNDIGKLTMMDNHMVEPIDDAGIQNNTEMELESALLSLVTTAGPSLKLALLIANQSYENQASLTTCRNEVAAVANILKKLDFHVICLSDVTRREMQNAINTFSKFLVEGVYGFFYFAGHGIEINSKKFLMPVDVPADYIREDMICENILISKCLKKSPALLVVVLDMGTACPNSKDNPAIHNEVAGSQYDVTSILQGNLISACSTSNSPKCIPDDQFESYASILCKFLDQNWEVYRVLRSVSDAFSKNYAGKENRQVPYYTSSLKQSFSLTDNVFYDKKFDKLYADLKELITFPNLINSTSENDIF